MSDEAKTGQTGQEPHKEPYFEVAADKAGKWNWILWAQNGRPLATNPQTYDRRNDCTEAIKTMRMAIPKAKKVVIVHK